MLLDIFSVHLFYIFLIFYILNFIFLIIKKFTIIERLSTLESIFFCFLFTLIEMWILGMLLVVGVQFKTEFKYTEEVKDCGKITAGNSTFYKTEHCGDISKDMDQQNPKSLRLIIQRKIAWNIVVEKNIFKSKEY